jgi:hypothetical protein
MPLVRLIGGGLQTALARARPPSPEEAILARAAQRLSDAELATLVAMGREQRGGSLQREMTEVGYPLDSGHPN